LTVQAVFFLALLLIAAPTLLLLRRRVLAWQSATRALAESEEKLRGLFELSPLGIARTDMSGRFVEFNEAFRALTGYSEDEVKALDYWALTPRSFDADEACQLDSLKSSGSYGPYEKQYIRKDGTVIPVRLQGMLVQGGDGSRYIWSMVEDVSERRRIEGETLLAANVFQTASEAIVVTDAEARIISVNPAFTRVTGYPASEVVGKNPRMLKSDHHDPAYYQEMWEALLQHGRWQGEIWNRRRDGEAFLAWETISAVRDHKGDVVRFVAVLDDMTDIQRKDQHISHLAYHDALTGLPNRLLVQDRLAHRLEIARRNSRGVAVMFIDLDHFKVVNDSLGHEMGDQLLVQVTERLNDGLRRSDLIGRLGGDEFVVVVSEFDGVGELTGVAENIIRRLADPFSVNGLEVHMGASIGIALFPEDGDDVTTLMKNADGAMYGAKAAGRNSFRFFDAAVDGAASERLTLEADLRRAIEMREFQLYYQPKVDLLTGRLAGAEALIRWVKPQGGIVPPNVFIPLAEDTGLVVPIGDWVLEESCRQVAEWRRDGLSVKVAINVSARQFHDRNFAGQFSAMLELHSLEPWEMEIELTERTVMSDPERAVTQLTQLRQMGATVSVDDFGTGYSSLAYLKRLPLDTIKIDRSFVTNVDRQSDNAAIVRAILGLSQALGMSTVAEGIETVEEERFLQDAGCHYAQGYRYAKPLSAEQFRVWAEDEMSHRNAAGGVRC